MTITWEKPALQRVGLGRQVGIVTAAVAAYFGVRGATEAATDRAGQRRDRRGLRTLGRAVARDVAAVDVRLGTRRGAARNPLLRAFGAAMPVLMASAVILTANHYIVDAIAGATLTATCWWRIRAREQQREQPGGYAGWDGLRLR